MVVSALARGQKVCVYIHGRYHLFNCFASKYNWLLGVKQVIDMSNFVVLSAENIPFSLKKNGGGH